MQMIFIDMIKLILTKEVAYVTYIKRAYAGSG